MFTILNILFTFRIFEQLALALKTELPWNFSLYWNIFYHSGFLSNLRLPRNFSNQGGWPLPPPRTHMDGTDICVPWTILQKHL